MNDAQKKNRPPPAKPPAKHGRKVEGISWKKLKGRQKRRKQSFQEERNTNTKNQTERMRNVEPIVQAENKP